MFLLDSLMISGLKWVMKTVVTSAEAEMNDDTALREQLLEAEMRREMGEISDDDFAELEADLLGRIREIKERREGGSGPLAFGGGEPVESSPDSTFQVEASVSGDFYDPADAPHTTVIETTPVEGQVLTTVGGQETAVLDMEEGAAEAAPQPSLPLSAPARGRAKAKRRKRTSPARRTTRTSRAGKLSR
jgi:hypothetical protein